MTGNKCVRTFREILLTLYTILATLAFALTFMITVPTMTPANAEPVRGRVLFIGDIMVHDQQLNAAERRDSSSQKYWDFTPQFHRVRPLLTGAFVVGNLETTFAGGDRGYAGYPLFNTPDSLTDALNDLDIDLLTLANNHILDRGTHGALRTVDVLDQVGLPWVGLGVKDKDVLANDAVLLERDGFRWAFVNFTYGSNNPLPATDSGLHVNIYTNEAIAEGLARARDLNPDVIIACFHWGNEYHYNPNSHQKRAADQAIANGADLVIGTHPHVLQPVEIRFTDDGKTRAIAWSLGNFVSFQRTLPRERTCILAVEFERDDNGNTRLVRLSTAPLQVILMPSGNRNRRTEVTYAGLGGKFNHNGLTQSQLKSIRSAGRAVLDFLGAQDDIDEIGFYTLWTEDSPDVLPIPRKKSPLN